MIERLKPVFDYWRMQPALKVWEIAFLMRDFEPRLRSDITVRDRENPTSSFGIEPDISDEVRMLADAIRVGDLSNVCDKPDIDEELRVSAASLLPWLVAHGFEELASRLTGYASACARVQAPVGVTPVQRHVAQEQAVLEEIRKQGHDPLTLPRPQKGRAGVKAEVCKALKDHPLFKSRSTVFDKTWTRLRRDQMIVDGS